MVDNYADLSLDIIAVCHGRREVQNVSLTRMRQAAGAESSFKEWLLPEECFHVGPLVPMRRNRAKPRRAGRFSGA